MLTLLGLLVLYLIYFHFKKLRTVEFYRAQGAYALPGYDRFLVGHSPLVLKWNEENSALIGTEKRAIKQVSQWIIDQTTESKAEDSFDFARHTVQIVNHAPGPVLYISDPLIIQDMMVKKNALMDKREAIGAAMKNFLGDGFIFSTTD